ncbi:MAG TPA: methyltransferase domain-containing protein [Gammaproteobacteria bacterium]|nr:methyltransferase domain-containing protein [Gammaproteobacteria bacterium]
MTDSPEGMRCSGIVVEALSLGGIPIALADTAVLPLSRAQPLPGLRDGVSYARKRLWISYPSLKAATVATVSRRRGNAAAQGAAFGRDRRAVARGEIGLGLNCAPLFMEVARLHDQLPHGFKRWTSFGQVRGASQQLGEEWLGQSALQRQLADCAGGVVEGYCAACLQPSSFQIRVGDDGIPNWRETLECAHCGLINRWRASVHLWRLLPRPPGDVYITEQTTLLFERLSHWQPGLVGSEYVSAEAAPGESRPWNQMTLRHEDVTNLSFAGGSLAAVLSFDVLEHVPDYRAAVSEFARALEPEGLLILTAPFSLEAATTTIRAQRGNDGTIEHLLPPVYHDDPLSGDGVLCYQEFGWDLVDDLGAAGFAQAEVITCWAPAYGYLGSAQPFVIARR